MRITFQHKDKRQAVANLKTGVLQDIAPHWFPPNALLQIVYCINDGKVHLEGYPKSMYFKPPNGVWSRATMGGFTLEPPFSISASQRGTYTVTFYLDKHERDVPQHTNKQLLKCFSTADISPTIDQCGEFATISSGIISIKEANHASICFSDLSKTGQGQFSTSKIIVSTRLRMHPSAILRENPFGSRAQENSFSSILDESSLSLTVLQPRYDALYILTTCQDTSKLDAILSQLLGSETMPIAGSTSQLKGSFRGKYILIRRIFDLFSQFSYNWSLVMANRDTMLCLVDAVELWISPVTIFALLANVPIYSIQAYTDLLVRCQSMGESMDETHGSMTSTITLPYIHDLQAITMNSSLSQTLIPSRESLIEASTNTLYSAVDPINRQCLPQTFFLPEIETTVFASASELLGFPAQTSLSEIQAAIHRYIDWSLALTANKYTVWVRLALSSGVYNRLSHEIDQTFCISHCLTSTDMITDDSIILNLDGDTIGGTGFTAQNLCELFLRGPQTVHPEESTTEI